MKTIKLDTTVGIDISWEIGDDGVMRVESNLSEEDTKAVMPLLWPAWMFEKK